jgi:hypothetical protein
VYDNHRKGYQSDMRRGPYKIEKVLQDDNYLVHDHNLGKWNKINVEKLKLFIPILDNDVLPLENDWLERGQLVQPNVPMILGQPEPEPEDRQILNQPERDVQPQQQQPIQQQHQQPVQQLIQQRYQTRSRGILPGKAKDHMYRKDTYT